MVAVNDGTIKKIGHNKQLGNYIVLQDNYGNRFTYAQLGHVAKAYPVPKKRKLSASDFKLVTPERQGAQQARYQGQAARGDEAGEQAHRRRRQEGGHRRGGSEVHRQRQAAGQELPEGAALQAGDQDDRVHTCAHQLGQRPRQHGGPPPHLRSAAAPAQRAPRQRHRPARQPPREAHARLLDLQVLLRPRLCTSTRDSMELRPLHEGLEGGRRHRPRPHRQDRRASRPTSTSRSGPPASARRRSTRSRSSTGGSSSRRPRSTAPPGRTRSPRARGRATSPRTSSCPRPQLQQQGPRRPEALDLLLRPQRHPHRADRPRILAAMEYLADNGFRLTITSLKCGHSLMTTSGNVSEHSTGDAMDIAAINGVPVAHHQGPGTLADSLIKSLLKLQGTMQPHQIISLEDLPGPISFPLPDHWDHVHVGYYPAGTAPRAARRASSSSRCSSPTSGRSSSGGSPRSRTRRSRPRRRSTRCRPTSRTAARSPAARAVAATRPLRDRFIAPTRLKSP